MVAEARSNAEIAEARKTSQRTVANQLAAMYRKCGVSTREELIVALLEHRAGDVVRTGDARRED
jgi:DNA-binding CsgD family transcriptional regulator